VGGVLVGHICGITQSQGLAATFVSFVLYLCVAGWRRGRRIRDLALLAFAVATSCLYYAVRTDPHPVLPCRLLRSDPVALFGMVTSDAEEGFGRLRFEIQADSIRLGRRMYAAPCRVQVTTPGSGSAPRVGEVYMFEGELRRPGPLRNPGGFDARGHYARSGISYQLKCSEKNEVRQLRGRSVVPSFNWATSSLRRRLTDTFSRSIGGDEAALLSALLLGERSRTRGAISRKFSDAGVIHILAVSGLHVGILWLVLLVVLQVQLVQLEQQDLEQLKKLQ